METAEAMYKLLTETTSHSYTPDSFLREFQSICNALEVEFHKDSNLNTFGFEIVPGNRNKKSGLMLTRADIPETPTYYSRPGRSSLPYLADKINEQSYGALVSIGPHSIEYATSTEGHRYLTTNVEDSISGIPHLDYLTPESCYDLLVSFFNPQFGTDTWDTEQETLDNF